MATEGAIYLEANVDLNDLTEAIDVMIHEKGWCACEKPEGPIAVWSAWRVPERLMPLD